MGVLSTATDALVSLGVTSAGTKVTAPLPEPMPMRTIESHQHAHRQQNPSDTTNLKAPSQPVVPTACTSYYYQSEGFPNNIMICRPCALWLGALARWESRRRVVVVVVAVGISTQITQNDIQMIQNRRHVLFSEIGHVTKI